MDDPMPAVREAHEKKKTTQARRHTQEMGRKHSRECQRVIAAAAARKRWLLCRRRENAELS